MKNQTTLSVIAFIITNILMGSVIRPVLTEKCQYTYISHEPERVCCKCPPGTYKSKDCVGNYENAVCEECPPGTYQEVYNQAAYCEKCNLCNDHFQMLKTNCTKTKNSECSCEAGYKPVEGNGYEDHCSWTGTCPDGSVPKAKEGTNIFHCMELSMNTTSLNTTKKPQENLTKNVDAAGQVKLSSPYWIIVLAIFVMYLQGW